MNLPHRGSGGGTTKPAVTSGFVYFTPRGIVRYGQITTPRGISHSTLYRNPWDNTPPRSGFTTPRSFGFTTPRSIVQSQTPPFYGSIINPTPPRVGSYPVFQPTNTGTNYGPVAGTNYGPLPNQGPQIYHAGNNFGIPVQPGTHFGGTSYGVQPGTHFGGTSFGVPVQPGTHFGGTSFGSPMYGTQFGGVPSHGAGQFGGFNYVGNQYPFGGQHHGKNYGSTLPFGAGLYTGYQIRHHKPRRFKFSSFESFEDDSNERGVIYVLSNNELGDSRERTNINEKYYWQYSNGTHTIIVRKDSRDNRWGNNNGRIVVRKNDNAENSATSLGDIMLNTTDISELNCTELSNGTDPDLITVEFYESSDNQTNATKSVRCSDIISNGTFELLSNVLPGAENITTVDNRNAQLIAATNAPAATTDASAVAEARKAESEREEARQLQRRLNRFRMSLGLDDK
jgi:hypothetical protein